MHRGDGPAGALEAVDRLDEALDDVALQALHLTLEDPMAFGHDAVAVPQHRAEGQGQAGQQHEQRADDGRHRQVGGRRRGRLVERGIARIARILRILRILRVAGAPRISFFGCGVHGQGGQAAGAGHSRQL
ncbi:hypothetical protein [Roseateles chitinivorans]|uniref:hypothetical protein n=1 Tax=Roseateles chitinivorans TaxID=2917965 RepID=UPI003D674F5E